MTLLLMISFASVNAVMFTPALPNIASFFNVSERIAQQMIVTFLIGYAVGQLIYGPIANRFGRKRALYTGISLQIASSFLCVFAGFVHQYLLIVVGRFFLALGSGVGLKMTFTLVNEWYEPKVASQKISYLMLAFAVTPGMGVALGGFLNAHFGWQSTFYAGAIYGLILLALVTRLPETQKKLHLDALKFKHVIHAYSTQLKNKTLIIGGILMAGASCFVYVFAAIGPFIAMNLLHMNTVQYGVANLLPSIGLLLGSIFSGQFVKKYNFFKSIKLGILIALLSAMIMAFSVISHQSPIIQLFFPMMIGYFGLSLVFANASTVAMNHAVDKAHASAVMNFINMGLVTIVVITLSYLPATRFLLPSVYIIICITMLILLGNLVASRDR